MISHPSTSMMPVLPMDVRLRIAKLAHVPEKNREVFCDVIQLPLHYVWELDRRAIGTEPQKALLRATDAARALHEAFENLTQDDREWVEAIRTKAPIIEKSLPSLRNSIGALANLFSVAVNKAPPRGKAGPDKRGRRPGDVKDLSFRQFVHYLLFVTEEWCGGELTLDKNSESGTLIDAIEILRDYLPRRVVPNVLPFQTIQRVRANPSHYAGFPEINFFRLN